MQRIEAGRAVYYEFDAWRGVPGLVHGVFTRLGGYSSAPWTSLNVGSSVGDDQRAVDQNAALMYRTLGFERDQACTVWQVHGSETVIATEPPVGQRWLAHADALVTDRIGLPLSMRFADCVPILLYDPVHHAVGMAHAGWRGTVGGVVQSALATMGTAFGTRSADLIAAIGPSIGPDCYQVGAEVVTAVSDSFGGTDGLIARAPDGSTYLDLWAANRLTLERCGVDPAHIEVSGMCTATHTDEFYSHRAEHGKTGRFGAVIALETR